MQIPSRHSDTSKKKSNRAFFVKIYWKHFCQSSDQDLSSRDYKKNKYLKNVCKSKSASEFFNYPQRNTRKEFVLWILATTSVVCVDSQSRRIDFRIS